MKQTKLIIFMLILSLLTSCKKDTCKITRYDLAYSYYVKKNGLTEFSITLWKIPPTPSSPIPSEVADSFLKINQMGYDLIASPGYFIVYEYADCDECEKLKTNGIEHECLQRK